MQEIEERLAAIKLEIDADGADLDALETEIKTLTEERKTINDKIVKRQNLVNSIVDLPKENIIKDFKEERKDMELTREDILASKEYRSSFFKTLQGKELNEAEKRAMTSAAASAGAAIPTTRKHQCVSSVALSCKSVKMLISLHP